MTATAATDQTVNLDLQSLTRAASALRVLSADMVEAANSGHPGLPLGMADAAAVLWRYHLQYNPKDPQWPNRDRFILSAGHGSALLYSALHLAGYDLPIEQLKKFRQLHSSAAGHPEYGYAPGIETTTGPLGQGIANAVGFALGQKIAESRYGSDVCDHYTYVIAGDGCLMEGISQEAISLAGHHNLSKLVVIFDNNGITIDGRADLSCSDNTRMRFEASGWDVFDADGHDFASVDKALHASKASPRPALIICTTVIGKYAGDKAGTEKCHGAPLGDSGIATLRNNIGWDAPAFEIPQACYSSLREDVSGREERYRRWTTSRASLKGASKKAYEAFLTGATPAECYEQLAQMKKQASEKPTSMATRKSSLLALESIAEHAPNLIGGSADLTGSNLTLTASMRPITPEDAAGNYIYYGIREHGMAAAMNGLALYGFIPYGGTFLVFTDYCRPSIRLSALMGLRVIYVMTHDSIGLGEDGPTHQPVEHIASLRAIPNLCVLRPADTVETAESWEIALQREDGPTLLALSRQSVDTLRTEHIPDNKCALGGYILKETHPDVVPDVVLVSSGTEVNIAAKAFDELSADGVNIRLVSIPSTDLLEDQGADYIETLIPSVSKHIVIEAGIAQGWYRFVNKNAAFLTVEQFGLSAPAPDVYKHLGITAQHIVTTARRLLDNAG